MLPGNSDIGGLKRKASPPVVAPRSLAASCWAFRKWGPGMAFRLASNVMMPFESRLSTLSPFFGTYVAKTWSKLRFSPMITITCLIGDVVLLSFEVPSCACAAGRPMANWAMARQAIPVRRPCRVPDTTRFKVMQSPSSQVKNRPAEQPKNALDALQRDCADMNTPRPGGTQQRGA